MPYITAPDGTPVDAPRPLIRPDGTPSKTGIMLVKSATDPFGGYQPVATTPEQVAELAGLLDAVPALPERRLQMQAVHSQVARQQNDALLRKVLRDEADLQAKTVLTPGTELPLPKSAAEEEARTIRADQAARALGYSGVVRDDRHGRQYRGMAGLGTVDVHGYAVVACAGTWYEATVYGGNIATIETVLQQELTERARREQQQKEQEAHRAKLAREADEDYRQSPAGLIAALRSEVTALKAQMGGSAAPASTGTYAERVAAQLAAEGITVEA